MGEHFSRKLWDKLLAILISNQGKTIDLEFKKESDKESFLFHVKKYQGTKPEFFPECKLINNDTQLVILQRGNINMNLINKRIAFPKTMKDKAKFIQMAHNNGFNILDFKDGTEWIAFIQKNDEKCAITGNEELLPYELMILP